MLKSASLIVLMSLITCVSCSQSTQPPREVYRINDSFEDGLSAWTIHSLDDKVDTLPIDWYVVSSDARAFQGSRSVEMYMDNMTDAAKIWLEQTMEVAPNRTYAVNIRVALASADQGAVNCFAILANVLAQKPTTHDDITSGVAGGDFPEGTYNGGIEDYVWLPKGVTKEVTTTGEGRLYCVLGIWGTWESSRTYYYDDLEIVVTAQ